VAMTILHGEREVIEAKGLTLLGLSVGNLSSIPPDARGVEQLLLPFGRKDRSGLDQAVDDLRRRFGNSALTRASLLGRRTDFEVPKLPD
jgi:DNA polymerase-4